jgi:hypothetical protein
MAPNIAYLFNSVMQLGAYRSAGVAPEHIRKNRFRRFGGEKTMGRGGDDRRVMRSESTLLVIGCLVLYTISKRSSVL